MVLRALAVALAMLLAAATAADAATLTLQDLETVPARAGDRYNPYEPPRDRFAVLLDDDRNEVNRVVVDERGRIRDDAAPLRAGEHCTVDAEGWGTCIPPQRPGTTTGQELQLRTGPGDDVVDVRPTPWTPASSFGLVDLGDGDDRLTSTGSTFAAEGGAGADELRAAPRTVTLGVVPYQQSGEVTWRGGPGPDRVSGAGATVSYGDRTGAVSVTPDGIADDGAPGEGDDVAPDVGKVIGSAGADVLVSSGGGVVAGLGDDTVTGRREPRAGLGLERLEGGPGNDRITGGAAGEWILGEDGDDLLDGGDGGDMLDDGPGRDDVDGGAGDDRVDDYVDGASDVWRGGGGTDRLSFSVENEQAVDVTLDGRANDGPPGEGDDVSSGWEDVEIDRGRLVGSNGPEQLTTRLGTLDGRGGDDVLVGGDTALGGSGRDTIRSTGDRGVFGRRGTRIDVSDGERDRVECGPGVSVVRLRRDRADAITGCFAYAFDRGLTPRRALQASRRVPFVVRCDGHQSCRGRLAVRVGAVEVAQRRFRIAAGTTRRLALAFGRRVTAVRRACGRVRVVVVTDSPFTAGDRLVLRQTRELAPPGRALTRCQNARDR